ncbi:MAG: hypothetical protein RJA19_355 [Bacteroidota bacterium]|jgi:large subunit ribosomal protein L19
MNFLCNIAPPLVGLITTEMDRIKEIASKLVEMPSWPDFKAGDTITVTIKIKEGNKERLQKFQGVVIQRRGIGHTATFTVRKVTSGIGVERIFPVTSPFIEEVEVNKRGRVRRARIFYLRDRMGKSARIKEKRYFRPEN